MRFGLREMLFVVLLLGVIGVFYACILRTSHAEQAKALAEIARDREILAQLEREMPRSESVDEEIRKLQEVIIKAEERLPAQREEQVILKEVTELAQTHK